MPFPQKLERMNCISSSVLSLVVGNLFAVILMPTTRAQEPPRRFTVADDIGITRFDSGVSGPAIFSPDGRYFVVVAERGRLDINRSESSLRVYLTEDVHHFLRNSDSTGEPPPFWVLTKSTYKNGPIITDVRWLADSGEIAFLAKDVSGQEQLHLANILTRTDELLTPDGQDVTAFDIHSRRQYVYCVLSPTIGETRTEENRAAAIVGTGRALDDLLFPDASESTDVWVHDISDLWAVVDDRRFRVVDASSGQPVPIHLEGQRALALAPDGHSVVTALAVSTIPKEWEAFYLPPVASSPYKIRSGRQNPYALAGQRDVSEYVLIDLSNGTIESLTNSPIGDAAGWWGVSHADWSIDGQSVLLSNTFLPPKTQGLSGGQNGPCVAVIDIGTGRVSCVVHLGGEIGNGKDANSALIENAGFVDGDKEIVTVRSSYPDGRIESTTFVRLFNGSWSARARLAESTSKGHLIEISVRQDLNDPPVLLATDEDDKESSVIWDPNPQLKNIGRGRVSVFRWTDKTGRSWVGGLYKPRDYVQGKRYPLVIQTHGFDEHEFSPSGSFTTAFAAQELASAGILVLQVRDCAIRNTPQESPCQIAGYEGAVERLARNGMVDPSRVGIIGFSRTCYYVLEALTTSSLRIKAASITDGVNEGYLQYILNVDLDSSDSIAHEGDATIGVSPFGIGLVKWLRRSPEFNMDKVRAPLLVVATTPEVLQMWGPYAALRYLKKPVELLVLHSDEHVLTNPAERMISQGSTVDWFRFWLQGYEDRSPGKSDQYKRWEAMRTRGEAIRKALPEGTNIR